MRMREDIVGFLKDGVSDYPFYLELAGVSWCDGAYHIERKSSPIYVFEYIISGKGTVNVNGTSFTAAAGDIYMLPRGSSHHYYSDSKDPWVKIWFNASGPLLDSLMQVYRLEGVCHVQGLELEQLFRRMFECARVPHEDVAEVFSAAALTAHEIILAISSAVHRQGQTSSEGEALRRFIDRNIYSGISIAQLAELIFRSPSQTIRIFKKEFGVPPYEYLMQKRVETARMLLLNTSLSVKEIAYRLNFADEHYFSNYFKKKTGLSPLKLRLGRGEAR